MKTTYWLIIAVAIISIAGATALEHVGYHRIKVEDGTLYGRAMGSNKDLVVLLVAGSGPTDMDGNTPLIEGKNNSLLYLAKDLARQGFSTFRYDKRTAGKSKDTFDLTSMEFDWFADDCIAVIKYLRQLGYKTVVIVGHSKGSLVGMLAAAGEPVDGFISIGGTGHTIDITMERQLLNFYPADSKEIQVIHSLRQGIIEPTQDENSQFDVAMQKFLLSWMKHNPAEILRSLTIPALIIQGEADVQAGMQDFEAFLPVNNSTQTVVIPHMNHVLKRVENDKENRASYTDPAYPLHEDLIPSIVGFINGVAGK